MAAKGLKRIILWLRNDLRISDHEPLVAAIKASGGNVVPIYVFDPRQYRMTKYGFRKTGPRRAQFTIECVQELRESLRKIGSGLIVRSGLPECVIPEIAGEIDAQEVYCHSEVTSEELEVEQALAKELSLKTFWGATTLYPLDDLPEEVDPRRDNLPRVFSQYRVRIEANKPSRAVLDAPVTGHISPLPTNVIEGDIPSVRHLTGEDAPPRDPRSVLPFMGGEQAGRDRVKYYLWDSDLLSSYKDTRDGLIGGDYSSKFAPWLALGCITSSWIHSEIIRYEHERTANKSTYWLVFELLWRDYFRFVAIQHGNALFKPTGLQNKRIQWLEDKQLFEAWRNGNTGFPFVDANMRELMLTGFMGNRGRQNVASFLTKDLCLDWRAGAAWFESTLLDYDVCSNYGNWNYAAGIGNDPREDRHFNIPKQAKTYDPSGEYVRLWIPELAHLSGPEVHEPYLIPNSTYTKPIIQRLGRSKMPLDLGGKAFAGGKKFHGPPHINQRVREEKGAPPPNSFNNSGSRVMGGYRKGVVPPENSLHANRNKNRKSAHKNKMDAANPEYDNEFPTL